MPIAMPNTPESLTYSVAAAIVLTLLAALVLLVSGELVATLLALAIAGGIHWLIGRQPAMIVTAREAAAAIAVLLALCAFADLAIDYPYRAVVFLLAAGALGFAYMLLQQGTAPVELRLGGVLVVAASGGLIHLRMLEELRDTGILSAEEFAAKRLLVEATP
jgi:hypothetical protein